MKILKKLLPILLILGIACTFFACKEDDTTDGTQDGVQDGTTDGTQGDQNQGGSGSYTVTFDYNYEGAPEAVKSTVNHNDRAHKPETDPTREGYDFTGWYVDSACMIEQTFLSSGVTNSPVSKVTADTTFYAGWILHVEAPTLVSINAVYIGSAVELNSNLNSAQISVTATYDDNSSKAVTDFTVSELDTTTAGVKTVTVTYVENDVTKTVDITVEVIDPSIPDNNAVTLYFKSEVAWANANIWAWEGQVNHTGGTWPGAVMSSEGNGWFSYTFAEGIVPTNVIFNNGSSQTTDLVYDGTNNYYVFNPTTGAGAWGADENITAPVVEAYTIYFKNVNNWSTVNAYAWVDGAGTTAGSWPGTAMTAVGNGWYSITVSLNTTHIIFNNGSGSQTDDLVIDGNNLYYNGSSWTNSMN